MSPAAALGIASGVAGVVACPLYVRDTLRGSGQPDRISWASWVLAYGVLFAAQAADGAGVTLWLNGTELAATALIWAVSWRYGTGTLTAGSVMLLGCDGAALVGWYMTSPATATALMLGVIGTAALPTIVKAYRQPGSEPVAAWWWLVLAGALGVLAVAARPGPAALLYAYPGLLVGMAVSVTAAGLVGAATTRRPAAVVDLAGLGLSVLQYGPGADHDHHAEHAGHIDRATPPVTDEAAGSAGSAAGSPAGVAFVAHCLVNQNSKVGDGAHCAGVYWPLVGRLRDAGWRIEQLTCPELAFAGHNRWWMTIEQYDTAAYREHCRRQAEVAAERIRYWMSRQVPVALLGVDGSPSMGVQVTSSDPRRGGAPEPAEPYADLVAGEGIFTAALRDALATHGLGMIPAMGEKQDLPPRAPEVEDRHLDTVLAAARTQAARAQATQAQLARTQATRAQAARAQAARAQAARAQAARRQAVRERGVG